MCATLYAFAPQGRARAVKLLTLEDAANILKNGYVLSRLFKTAATFEYQPICNSKEFQPLLTFYLDYMRPNVVAYLPSNPELLSNSPSPLWLTWYGKHDQQFDFSRYHRDFYVKRMGGVRLTTTTVRGIVETTVESFRRQGLMSASQSAALNRTNGHSADTARTRYVREQRHGDVADGMDFMALVKARANSGKVPTVSPVQQVRSHDFAYSSFRSPHSPAAAPSALNQQRPYADTPSPGSSSFSSPLPSFAAAPSAFNQQLPYAEIPSPGSFSFSCPRNSFAAAPSALNQQRPYADTPSPGSSSFSSPLTSFAAPSFAASPQMLSEDFSPFGPFDSSLELSHDLGSFSFLEDEGEDRVAISWPGRMDPVYEDYRHRPWGTNHPQFKAGSSNTRIDYSLREQQYLQAKFDKLQKQGQEVRPRALLEEVLADDQATAIFHLKHVSNEAMKTALKKLKKQAEETPRR
jgi:hypothetical protein